MNALSSEVHWSVREEGSSIQGSFMSVEDGDYSDLTLNTFTDIAPMGFIRFGISEKEVMDFSADISLTVNFEVKEYNNLGVIVNTYLDDLTIEYYTTGGAPKSVNMDELRLANLHKFELTVQSITATEIVSGNSAPIPTQVYLEAGFNAERYYYLD
ncbi:MAG: hypothetical protein COA32_10795, partial [Fluviicola sp.]